MEKYFVCSMCFLFFVCLFVAWTEGLYYTVLMLSELPQHQNAHIIELCKFYPFKRSKEENT